MPLTATGKTCSGNASPPNMRLLSPRYSLQLGFLSWAGSASHNLSLRATSPLARRRLDRSSGTRHQALTAITSLRFLDTHVTHLRERQSRKRMCNHLDSGIYRAFAHIVPTNRRPHSAKTLQHQRPPG